MGTRLFRVLLVVLVLTLLSTALVNAQSSDRTITMASDVEIPNIDPAVGFDQATGSALKQFYDALFRYEGNPPKVVPWLADSYTVSADGKTYTMMLDPKAKFQDGSPVTADAVVYSAERLLAVGQGAAGLFTGILSPGNTKAVDDHTVQFTLDQPYGPFLDILTWLFIVNPTVVEANKGTDNGQTWLTDHEAGSGPYTMGDWEAGQTYTFVADPNYWKGWPSDSYPTTVVREVVPESSTRRLDLESGNADIIDWMSVDDIKADDGVNGMKAAPGPTISVYDVKMNTQHGPTADVNFRQAISYAVDYASLDAIWDGEATPLVGPLPPAMAGDMKPTYTTDLDKAKAALAKSAYANGTTVNYVYVTGLEDERRTGLVLQDSLSQIGITVNIQDVTWADAVASFSDATTSPDMFPLYSSTAFADPDNYLWAAFDSSMAGNWTNPGHYQNPAVDALLVQARATVDDTQRTSLYNQAAQLILADAPNIFVAATPEDHIIGPRITNYDSIYCPVMGSMEDFYFFQVASS